MARTIPHRELRNQNAKILDAVEAGETFVVTRNGVPVAELRPYASGRRRFVPREELARRARASGHIDYAQFRRDMDAVVDQSLYRE